MSNEKFYKKLDELFDDAKSKNFINHLVRSYLPVSKTEQVWDTPKGKFRCVITNAPLISVEEALKGVESEQFRTDFMEHLKSWSNEENRVESPMKKMLKGRVLGFTGDNTNTYMSQEGFHIFYDWVVTKMLKGDKHINWLLNTIDRQDFITRAEAVADDVETKKAVERLKKSSNEGRATMKLGDLGVLQQLKEKMETSENK